MNIIFENNKKIAEFMGYEYIPYNSVDVLKHKKSPGWWKKDQKLLFRKIKGHYLGRSHKDLKYNVSFDWLMEVVEYIESIDLSEFYHQFKNNNIQHNFEGISVQIENNSCMIYVNLMLDKLDIISNKKGYNTKIEAVYYAVLDFINTYNKLKNIK